MSVFAWCTFGLFVAIGWGLTVTTVASEAAEPPPHGGIRGLAEALNAKVVAGQVIHIEGPPSEARDRDDPPNTTLDHIRPHFERRKGPGSVYQSLRPNWLTVQHPDVPLDQIAKMLRQRYDQIVLKRVKTPNVTQIDVEHMTLIFPPKYFNNDKREIVRVKRLAMHAKGRQLVAYYANYDKIDEHDGAVILQINGHFGRNPSRLGLGLEKRGGYAGAALGKIAMQHLPLITYDDHNTGESSGAPNGLPRTLENIQMIDRTLLKHFDRVDGLGLSGGTERWYHFSVFFESNVQSVYYAGFAVPLWTRLDRPHFGSDPDTHDEPFIRNFQCCELALVGIHRIPHVAFAHNANEGGGSKYGYFVEMVPTMRQLVLNYLKR